MSKITNQEEKLQAIDILTRSLAYVQEYMVLEKVNPEDLSSIARPSYMMKEPLLKGDNRKIVEDKLIELVKCL